MTPLVIMITTTVLIMKTSYQNQSNYIKNKHNTTKETNKQQQQNKRTTITINKHENHRHRLPDGAGLPTPRPSKQVLVIATGFLKHNLKVGETSAREMKTSLARWNVDLYAFPVPAIDAESHG